MIRVVIKRPNELAYVTDIKNDYETIRNIIGGYLEVFPFAFDIICICDEEGKLKGLKPNFIHSQDVIVGTVIFAGVKGENFASLTGDQINFLLKTLG